jgi:glycosyltransferase involved in cell wall biosynthesis
MAEPSPNPRVLFVGRGRHRLPLAAWLAKKWDAIEELIDYRVLGAAEPGSGTTERFRLDAPARPRALDGVLFYVRLPFRIRHQIQEFDPDVIVATDPLVGAAVLMGRRLARATPPLIVEVHGDWRTFPRLYGSPARRLLAPATDRISLFVLRRADATRALSRFTSSLIEDARGEPATAMFPTYSDLSAFVAEPVKPLPTRPVALFVGVLEAYKNIDGLAAAWRRVVTTVPDAVLVIVGKGTRRQVVDDLLRDLPTRVEYHAQLLPSEVAAKLDAATLLVLPSWPEGLGRVIIEAFARGRGVVATGAGGVLDLVTSGVEGILIPRGDTDALVSELSRVLTDPGLAERLGAAAHERYSDWHATAEDFARETRDLVDLTLARSNT